MKKNKTDQQAVYDIPESMGESLMLRCIRTKLRSKRLWAASSAE